MAISGHILVVSAGAMLLPSGGSGSGILLNVLQHTERPSTTESERVPQVRAAQRGRPPVHDSASAARF